MANETTAEPEGRLPALESHAPQVPGGPAGPWAQEGPSWVWRSMPRSHSVALSWGTLS